MCDRRVNCAAVLFAALVVCAAQSVLAAPPRLQRLFNRPAEATPATNNPATQATATVDGLEAWLLRLQQLVPRKATEFSSAPLAEISAAANAVESWAAQHARGANNLSADDHLRLVGRLLDVKQSVDLLLEATLAQRGEFLSLENKTDRETALRNFLQTHAVLGDLSGRLRYGQVDLFDGYARRFATSATAREQLIDLAIAKRSSVAAQVLAADLFDPEGTNVTRVVPLNTAQKLKLIQLIATSGTQERSGDLADFVLDPITPASQLLAASEAIRTLGLPQNQRPGQDTALPLPAITADELKTRLLQVEPLRWQPAERPRVEELLAWLSTRANIGVDGSDFRIGQFAVRPGDWLLMRNPSPYNLFTNLSPGLFTHVGVVALETGRDGKRRMVIVDLPERGSVMPATNAEIFLDRTLNYMFLRHRDPVVARKMGEAAAAMIGNPTEFDLNFRTDRLESLRGKPLAGQKIHTYCAGFLLLCAQQTGLPREVFFPITETTAGGHTAANLQTLGLSLGDGFVSPTGAIFSSQLEIVGRREPMYDPRREIEEAVYDYFAKSLAEKTLRPTPDAFQSLRLKVAEASRGNSLLAAALAAGAGVSAQMDLVSAAKAAAVVETLDEIAYGASGEYLAARRAIMQTTTPPSDDADAPVPTAAQQAAAQKYRSRHADLTARWQSRVLSPRTLRVELVNYYRDRGREQIDARFFGGDG